LFVPTVRTPERHDRLDVGDPLTDPAWFGIDGREFPLASDKYAGRRTVLLVCRTTRSPTVEAEIGKVSELADQFEACLSQVLVVTPHSPAENAETTRRLNLAIPVLTDPSFSVGRALRLADPGSEESDATAPFVTVLLNLNRRVEKIFGAEMGPTHASAVLEECERLASASLQIVTGSIAPVLVVPNLLNAEHCEQLIQFWEHGEHRRGTVYNVTGSDAIVEDIKVRTDVFLPNDGAEARELVSLCQRRLFPEIVRAFKFRVTRSETFRIGSYDARERGHFRSHRDDTSPHTKHRRFAMSLNLNTGEYEGGELHFPEYGHQRFDVERGGAVVFSCSLLHEALQVTAGRRFGVFSFFYGEADEKDRRRRNPDAPEAMLVDTPTV
jgi:peroxiredoxin/predicted 2-oxoglutarate/Fe(II)-dependent dioxygenase YbiX